MDHKSLQLITPWKGRLRSSNIAHGSFQTLCINFHVDGDLNDSKKSVGEESKFPSIITLKTFDNNSGIQRSTRIKYLIHRLTYDGFVAHHYTYMVRVIQEVEPTCFEPAIKNPK